MGDLTNPEMKQVDKDGYSYYLQGNGKITTEDNKIMLSNSERWLGATKTSWRNKFITYNSGMEFVIALDIDFDGRIAQANYNKYRNTPKTKARFEELRPWISEE